VRQGVDQMPLLKSALIELMPDVTWAVGETSIEGWRLLAIRSEVTIGDRTAVGMTRMDWPHNDEWAIDRMAQLIAECTKNEIERKRQEARAEGRA